MRENLNKKKDLLFVENFHGVKLFGGFVLNKQHATERSCAESLNSLEIVQRRLTLPTQITLRRLTLPA